jgi:hypothetical protein
VIDELLLQRMCKPYNIKYKIIEGTDTILLDSNLDEWMVKIDPSKERPYCLMHKNKIRQTKKYHVQKWLRTLPQLIDRIIGHKMVLNRIYGSTPIHKQKNKINKYKNNSKGVTC